ncbi:hypothetical protein [Nostoc sp. UHCC 0302]
MSITLALFTSISSEACLMLNDQRSLADWGRFCWKFNTPRSKI